MTTNLKWNQVEKMTELGGQTNDREVIPNCPKV